MSLDVYLTYPNDPTSTVTTNTGIFVRREGATVAISRAEWDRLNPDREPVMTAGSVAECTEIFHTNITHNLTMMADAAGLYKELWRPGEIGITKAAQLVDPLCKG